MGEREFKDINEQIESLTEVDNQVLFSVITKYKNSLSNHKNKLWFMYTIIGLCLEFMCAYILWKPYLTSPSLSLRGGNPGVKVTLISLIVVTVCIFILDKLVTLVFSAHNVHKLEKELNTYCLENHYGFKVLLNYGVSRDLFSIFTKNDAFHVALSFGIKMEEN